VNLLIYSFEMETKYDAGHVAPKLIDFNKDDRNHNFSVQKHFYDFKLECFHPERPKQEATKWPSRCLELIRSARGNEDEMNVAIFFTKFNVILNYGLVM